MQESPFQDYDYDFGSGPDSSFDFDFANGASGQMIGDLPNLSPGNDSNDSSKATSPENDGAEKRSYPDEDEGDREENGNKRRESEGKVPKKPGRKPLTNEPSSVSSPRYNSKALPLSIVSPSLTKKSEKEGAKPCRSACLS